MMVGPRGLFERRSFKKLQTKVPGAGDILISKIFSTDEAENAGALAMVRAGQAFFSHHLHGSRNSEHAGIVTIVPDPRRDTDHLLYELLKEKQDPMKGRRPGQVAESNGSGIGLYGIDYTVDKAIYRPTGRLRQKNSLGVSVVDEVLTVANRLGAITSSYNQEAAVRSLFKLSMLQSKGRSFINEVAQVVADRSAIPRMFCSQFVVVVYEVAALRAGQAPVFEVDPSAVTPKLLESMMERSDLFNRSGRL